VQFAAAISNESSSTLPIERPCGRPFEFEIYNSAGTRVQHSNSADYPCASDSTTTALNLPPGYSLSGGETMVGLKAGGAALPAGTYYVRAIAQTGGTLRASVPVTVVVPAP
jgi:hypothetical protein